MNDSFASLDPEELLQMLAGEDDDEEEEEGRDIVTDLDGRLAGAIGRTELQYGLKRKRSAGNEEGVCEYVPLLACVMCVFCLVLARSSALQVSPTPPFTATYSSNVWCAYHVCSCHTRRIQTTGTAGNGTIARPCTADGGHRRLSQMTDNSPAVRVVGMNTVGVMPV